MNVTPRDEYWLRTEKYFGETPPEYYEDLDRLSRGEPIAYVIGWIPFLRARIKLDHRPLIPRPETEFWVSEALRILADSKPHLHPFSFADCYTGSGCIGISALQYFPKSQCTFIDIGNEECISVQENVNANIQHKDRAHVIQGDAIDFLIGPYDAIFANPPYIPENSTEVDESVSKWEPYRALFAENKGLREIDRLLLNAKTHLHPDGFLFVEFGKGQEVAILELPSAQSWDIEYRKDQYEVIRWFIAKPKHHGE